MGSLRLSTTCPGAADPDTFAVVGDPAPDFALADAVGACRLSELRGSPVVLAFHPAGWDPARAEYVAAYNRLITRLPGLAGARLLSVAGDGPSPWHELAFEDATVAIPVVRGEREDVARRYGVAGRAAVFVIDAAGRVRWRHVAGVDAPVHPTRSPARSARRRRPRRRRAIR